MSDDFKTLRDGTKDKAVLKLLKESMSSDERCHERFHDRFPKRKKYICTIKNHHTHHVFLHKSKKKSRGRGKKSFEYTTKDGETRKYELVEGKKGAMLYKCVENCAEKRKKSKKKQRKDLARQAAKAARRRSSNQRKRSRRASKKAKDCDFGERYVKGKGCVMRKQSQFAGKFMPEFGGGDQCSTLLAGHYLSRIQNAIIAGGTERWFKFTGNQKILKGRRVGISFD